MLNSVTLNDKDAVAVTLHSASATAKRVVTSAQGLAGIPSGRQSVRPRPTAHGVVDDTQWTEGKLIQLAGEITSDVSLEDCISEFRVVTKPMLQTLENGPALLKWAEGVAGLSLQAKVRLASPVEPVYGAVGAILTYDAAFLAEDPRAYSQTEQTVASAALSAASGGAIFPLKFPVKFTPSGGGTATVSNAGNRTTPPKFRVYGLCTDPQILNVTTGERIALTKGGVTVNTGDYLEVDVAERTVKLNGVTNRANFVDSANTQWFELGVGNTEIRLLASSFNGSARVDTILRAAYA